MVAALDISVLGGPTFLTLAVLLVCGHLVLDLGIARLIITKKIGAVPVVDGSGRPVGLLTQKDVLAAVLELAEQPGR